jgi:hypothetical protein
MEIVHRPVVLVVSGKSRPTLQFRDGPIADWAVNGYLFCHMRIG